jgi:hypothetical protein
VGRGQDNLFGTTLAHMDQSACVAHLPWALVHAPEEPRRFHAGEVTRSASGIDLATLVRVCLNSLEPSVGQTRSAGLTRVGRHLQEIGSLAPRDFDAFVQARWRAEACRLIAVLDANLSRHPNASAAWVQDTRTFIALFRQSLTGRECGVPLDLTLGRSMDDARRLAQKIVRTFGELIVAWPALIDAARRLRERGQRLTAPAGVAV